MRPAWLGCQMTCFCCITGTTIIIIIIIIIIIMIIIIIITLFESQIILAEHECCTNW